ncbi:hypothetical protein HU200_051014 [Digitaria exilis]|uniref:Plastid lipid-associated protein/fibrillin conserved domain-containing protein n=1 Tax=Digitaria exilis TaxID=1010633 RepID=A0A835AW63_9POAL|nr:hypothetical protein HU200_051014 [Digitaria exilis]
MVGVAMTLALRAPSPSPAAPYPCGVAGAGAALAFREPPSFPSLHAAARRRGVVLARAAVAGGDTEDEWGPPEPAVTGAAAVAEAEAPASPEASEVAGLKARLKEALYGTERGLRASSETRAEIVELITQLEARNPTPAPTEALTLLNGKWILAYTSFSQLFPLLGSGRLPELVKIKFDEGVIGTPQLTDSIVLPEKFELFGQNIDLSPLKGIFSSIENAASSVAKTISGQPPLKIPIRTDNAESWLLTTYLDEDLRISRGDGSSIFVLFKEGSTLLY